MQEGKKKEKWDKPKLLILTRVKPEEAALTQCKRSLTELGPAKPVFGWTTCIVDWGGHQYCSRVDLS